MILEPFGFHWSFAKYTYAILPKGSRVLPIFIRKGFSDSTEQVFIDLPRKTDSKWYINDANLFKATDFIIDSVSTEWTGKMISTMIPLSELALSVLPKPEENNLQGRTYLKFLLFTSELTAYIKS